MPPKPRIALLLPLVPALLAAQSPIADPLLRWMDGMAQQQLAARERTIAAIRTPEQAQLRQHWVRAKILDLIGGLPARRTPLNPRITAKLTNASYTLEKVIFESLPSFYVTANLYRPLGGGKHPAVLLSAGHTTLGKTENHRIAASLAAKGFIALTYDPMGLGERVQAFDRRIGRSIAGCCTNEHLHAGAQSLLIGQSVARYFIWDAVRALDYLTSLPDVDAARVGAAGCSGGGALTTYIAALDPRIQAAAPACYLNTLRVLFSGPYPDTEMSLPGFLAAGLDHADFLELRTPMPWLILATEGDFFTPAGVRPVFDESRRWYGLSRQQERMGLFMAPGPHGTPKETREALNQWMMRWLNEGKGDPTERSIPLYSDRELQVTQSGQVEDEPGSRKLFQVIRDELRRLRQPLGVTELKAELQRLGVPTDGRPPAPQVVNNEASPQMRKQNLSIPVEPGLDISAALYLPVIPGRKAALLLVKDKTSAGLADSAVRQGLVVLELEPRDSPRCLRQPAVSGKLAHQPASEFDRAKPAFPEGA